VRSALRRCRPPRASSGRSRLRASPGPELFPVPDGGVQIEWSAGPVEIELEIEPDQRGAILVCDDEQSGQRIDGELPADASRFRLALARLIAHS